ncbi:hypothetical protein AB1L30_08715 [Bremerella sp. JC817]|uniref:hypothetical protein n=1 Tax=Bremerella sp. JC817 TaxID=3231756 RepID=UPI00345ABAEB
MHESTRRLLCRFAFLLGCVLPTICTLSWIMYRQSAWSVDSVEARLTDLIGLKCQITKYYNPKPSKWVFEDVRLERAGTDAVTIPVLKAELVDDTWQLSADEAEVDFTSRVRLWETLQEGILLDRSGGHSLRLCVGTIRFRDSSLPTFHQLDVKHHPHAQPALTSSMLVGNEIDAPPLVANLDTSHPQHWKVFLATTFEKPIDTYPLREALPDLAGLGPDARFAGQITMELNHPTPHLELAGKFEQIDLQTALASNQQLGSGSAELHFQRVVIRDNAFIEGRGGIWSYNGWLSRSMVDRAIEHLKVRVVPTFHQQDMVAYHKMAIGFELDHGRMKLTGLCSYDMTDMPVGTMLAGLEQPLVLESEVERLPATNLVSVFHDNNSSTIPASQPSVDWARWFTVPMLAEQPSGTRR